MRQNEQRLTTLKGPSTMFAHMGSFITILHFHIYNLKHVLACRTFYWDIFLIGSVSQYFYFCSKSELLNLYEQFMNKLYVVYDCFVTSLIYFPLQFLQSLYRLVQTNFASTWHHFVGSSLKRFSSASDSKIMF